MLQTFGGSIFSAAGCFYFAYQRGRAALAPGGWGEKHSRHSGEVFFRWMGVFISLVSGAALRLTLPSSRKCWASPAAHCQLFIPLDSLLHVNLDGSALRVLLVGGCSFGKIPQGPGKNVAQV